MGKDTRQSIAAPPGFDIEEDVQQATAEAPEGFDIEEDVNQQPRPVGVRTPGLGLTPEFNKGVDLRPQPTPGGIYIPAELRSWLDKNVPKSPDYETQLREAGTNLQPELALTTAPEAAVAGFSPILQAGKNVVSPIVAGAEKAARGYQALQPGQVTSFEDALRASADVVSGGLSAGINAIPAMMGVNAAMTAAPAAEELAGRTVGEITKRLAPAINPQLDQKIAQHIGERYGRKTAGAGIEYGVAAKFGLPVLVGMVMSKGAGAVTENVLADKTLQDEDKARIVDLVKNIAFFGGMFGTGAVRGAARQFKGPIDANRPITEPVGVSAGEVPSDISTMWAARARTEPLPGTPPIPILKAGSASVDPRLIQPKAGPPFTVDALGRATSEPPPAPSREARPEIRVTPKEDIAEDFRSIMSGHETPLTVEPKSVPFFPPEVLARMRGEAPEVKPEHVTPLETQIPAVEEAEAGLSAERAPGGRDVTDVTPTIEGAPKVPEFKDSGEAVIFGRTHPELIPLLEERARESDAKHKAIVATVPENETPEQKNDRLYSAIKETLRGQFAREAIDYAKHPKQLTPAERIAKERRDAIEAGKAPEGVDSENYSNLLYYMDPANIPKDELNHAIKMVGNSVEQEGSPTVRKLYQKRLDQLRAEWTKRNLAEEQPKQPIKESAAVTPSAEAKPSTPAAAEAPAPPEGFDVEEPKTPEETPGRLQKTGTGGSPLLSLASGAAYASVDYLPVDDDTKKKLKMLFGTLTVAGLGVAMSSKVQEALKDIRGAAMAKAMRGEIRPDQVELESKRMTNDFLGSSEADELKPEERRQLIGANNVPEFKAAASEVTPEVKKTIELAKKATPEQKTANESKQFQKQVEELPPETKAEIQPIEAVDPKGAVTEFLEKSRKGLEPSKELSDDLYRIETGNRADQIRARQLLERVDLTQSEAEELYRHDENSSHQLTPELQKKYDEYIKPLRDQTNAIISKIKENIPVSEEDYTPRIVKGKGNVIDRIVSGAKSSLRGGSPLSQTAGFLKHRVMRALEDAKGNRTVVAIKDGRVTAMRNKEATDLGPIKPKEVPNIQEYFDKYLYEPLTKLAGDLGIKHERVFKIPESRSAAGVSIGPSLVKTKVASPEQVLIHEIGHAIDNRYNLQDQFVNNPETRKELRALADLRYEGVQADAAFQRYVRKGSEKMAVMFEALLHTPEKFQQVAPKTYARFTDFLASHDELKPILDIKPSLVLGSRSTGEPKEPGTFTDKFGKTYKLTEATTDEIEKHTNLTYHKNVLANRLIVYNKARQVERAVDFLEGFKADPEFPNIAKKFDQGDIPANWRTTNLRNFAGYAFEPRVAEVLDKFADKMQKGHDPVKVFTAVNSFLRTSIFFNPLIHTPNITVHWLVNRGVTKFLTPGAYTDLFHTSVRAFNDVIHQNENYQKMLEEGAPLLYKSGEKLSDLLLVKMGKELEEKPAITKRMAEVLGYANPAALVKAVYRFSSRVTWGVNDWAILQAMYEEMGHGKGVQEAIADVGKHIPNYRIPARVLNSTAVANVMSNPNLTMFGAYHYGALKSYGEMAKSLLGKDVPLKERAEALDKIAMLGLTTMVIYPLMDELAKQVTGNKYATFRRAGAATTPYNIYQFAKGQLELTQAIQAIVTPSVLPKVGVETFFNRDLFSGKNIYKSEDIVDDPVRFIQQTGLKELQSIAPVGAFERIASGQMEGGRYAASLLGIKSPKQSPAISKAYREFGKSMTSAPDEEREDEKTLINSFVEKVKVKEKPTKEEYLTARKLKYYTLDGQMSQKLRDRLTLTDSQRFFKTLKVEDEWKTYQDMPDDERKDYRRLLVEKLQRGTAQVSPELRKEIGLKLSEERRTIPRSTGSYGR